MNTFLKDSLVWIDRGRVAMNSIAAELDLKIKDLFITFPTDPPQGVISEMHWKTIMMVGKTEVTPVEGILRWSEEEPTPKAYRTSCKRALAFEMLVAFLPEKGYIAQAMGAFLIDQNNLAPAMFKSVIISAVGRLIEEGKPYDLNDVIKEQVNRLIEYSYPHLELWIQNYEELRNGNKGNLLA